MSIQLAYIIIILIIIITGEERGKLQREWLIILSAFSVLKTLDDPFQFV